MRRPSSFRFCVRSFVGCGRIPLLLSGSTPREWGEEGGDVGRLNSGAFPLPSPGDTCQYPLPPRLPLPPSLENFLSSHSCLIREAPPPPPPFFIHGPRKRKLEQTHNAHTKGGMSRNLPPHYECTAERGTKASRNGAKRRRRRTCDTTAEREERGSSSSDVIATWE